MRLLTTYQVQVSSQGSFTALVKLRSHARMAESQALDDGSLSC
ncbi:hypothetical protein [Anabaena sp. UHCC 0399]|nr:hypothetical protein [Anabaena sp. UHCC 0399]MEA5564363.1 hypothetical protein [Anabaena sp. UHCC 0399]